MRRYLISMGIRTVCVVLVLVIDSPVRWVFAVLAVVLPYVAVVMANAGDARRGPAVETVPMVRIPLPGRGGQEPWPPSERIPGQPTAHSGAHPAGRSGEHRDEPPARERSA